MLGPSEVDALSKLAKHNQWYADLSTLVVVLGLVGEIIITFAYTKGKQLSEIILGVLCGIVIAVGVFGEYRFGSRAASENAELRRISDGRLADAQTQLATVEGQLATATTAAAKLGKQAEDERSARVKIEAAVAWRSLSDKQKRDIGEALAGFSSKAGASIWFNASSTDAEMFAEDIAEALRCGHITTTAPGGVSEMREGGKWNESIKPARIGVTVQCTKVPPACEFADAVIRELNIRGFDAQRQTDPPFDDKVQAPIIWVNVEPRPRGPQGEYKLQAQQKARTTHK